ncbi:MAG: PSD1 and planctomycete cytochrome C domain-containing protein, partial [Planctomycetia bacterium]|nr:PSD1 and planctomycete cytochrome C domain-containing protein [Planctomycetia bacterium]
TIPAADCQPTVNAMPRAAIVMRTVMSARVFLALAAALFCYRGASAADATIQFNRDVRPILSSNCFSCHGPNASHREAKLRLDDESGIRAEFRVTELSKSEAWRRINSDNDDERMPPPKAHKTLSAADKEMLRRWIAAGASFEKHWAFNPPVRPVVPASAKNPVDFFIDQKLSAAGIKPALPADRETLLRRVSFDLTGLPPTLAELDAFLAEKSPDAYEKQVDRLLASPRFGERMAVRWLDVSRYGDTNGYLHDIRRTGWPWRDWVIKAFNDDTPFDQFVVEQLAGDLLPGAKPEQVLATAFSRNHLITVEGGSLAAEYLNEYAADRVQTTATAFLGLTFNCCRCHDHKFDPLTQEDFYGMQAYFNSITEKHHENDSSPAYAPLIEIASPLVPQGTKAKVMVMQEAPKPTPTFVLSRGQYDLPDKKRPAMRRPPQVLGAPLAGAPVNRLGFAQWLVSPQDPLLARVTVNRLWQQMFAVGLVKSTDDFGAQGDYPTHPELLDFLAVEFRDGALNGAAKPWSTKHIVRLIVTSDAYRRASTTPAEMLVKDPENRLLGRYPRQRLSAEEIRDQALFVSGLLSEEIGGPPVYPYQPPGLWEERSNEGSNTKSYAPSQGNALHRRSLYTFWKRTCPPPVMTIFDAPDRTGCNVRRTVTNTPLQALAGLNDEQSLECAKLLAAHTLRDAKTTRDRLTLMVRRATAHTPTDADLRTLEAGLNTLLARYRAAPADAAALLRQGATQPPTGSNTPKLDPPELAAWMLVASAVLNLNETLVRN